MAKQSTVAASRKSAPRPVSRPGARRAHQAPSVRWGFPLTKMNLMVILGGVAVIIIAYLLMATSVTSLDKVDQNDGIWNNTNAVTIAPILLAIGYLGIIPFGIFYRFKKDDDQVSTGETAA